MTNHTRMLSDAELGAMLRQLPPDSKYPALPLDDVTYLPEMRATTYVMNPVLLCCAVFGIIRAQATRLYVERTYAATNGATVEFRGKELCQDDLTVLLSLLHLHAGMNVELPIKLAPTSFCAKIGWSDSKHNIKRLEECILRLQGAFLIVRTTLIANSEPSKLAKAIGAGWTLGFVTDFEFDGVLRWTVQLNPKLTQLFLSSPTYLIIAKRQALTAGLQTWLYGYIEANTCTYSVSLQTLAHAAGSTASLKEFARQVRDAIPKLIAARVLCANSTVKNGKVSFFKVQSSAPKRK